MSESTITISVDEYLKLKERSSILAMLAAYGVDNWQGYDEAMRQYYKSEEHAEDLEDDDYP